MNTTNHPIEGHQSPDLPASSVVAPRVASRRWWAVGLAALTFAGLSLSVARAQGFGGGHGRFMKERMEHVLTAAGASDAQKTQIQAIWQGLQPQIKPLRKQNAELRRQIGEAIAAPTIDKARVETLRKQSIVTMDHISALFTEGMLASAAVLTPTQRQQALKQIEEHRRHGGAADDSGE